MNQHKYFFEITDLLNAHIHSDPPMMENKARTLGGARRRNSERAWSSLYCTSNPSCVLHLVAYLGGARRHNSERAASDFAKPPAHRPAPTCLLAAQRRDLRTKVRARRPAQQRCNSMSCLTCAASGPQRYQACPSTSSNVLLQGLGTGRAPPW